MSLETRTTEDIRTMATTYAAATNRALSSILAKAIGDFAFLDRVDAGATYTVRRYDKGLRWFSAHWPKGLDWPAGIDRPAPAPPPPVAVAAPKRRRKTSRKKASKKPSRKSRGKKRNTR